MQVSCISASKYVCDNVNRESQSLFLVINVIPFLSVSSYISCLSVFLFLSLCPNFSPALVLSCFV